MAFEHNDIATKNRLMSGLGEELMGYEHNDIVTVDRMNEAIAEGGGGGGGSSADVFTDYGTISGSIPDIGEWSDGSTYGTYFSSVVIPSDFSSYYVAEGGTLTVNEKTYTLPDSWKSIEISDGLPSGISSLTCIFSVTQADGSDDYVAAVYVSLSTEAAPGSEPTVTASAANVGVLTLSKKMLIAMGYVS